MNASQNHCKNKEKIIKQDETETDSVLLPGLPNHLAQLCLSNIQPSLLYNVCTSWRRLIYSPHFPPFLSLYALGKNSSFLIQERCELHSVGFFCFDPVSWIWRSLPKPPSDPPLCLLSRHPSFISRILPIQSITASGHLVVIAANTHNFLPALTHPLLFDPLTSKWSFGPLLSTPRRWCVTGSIDGAIYVASGTGVKYDGDVARSIERWDMSKKEKDWGWENRTPFKDGRFSRDAIEAIGYRGKLCMVNVKGKAAKEGAMYDVVKDQWEEMPIGMLRGWNGAATTDDDVMYVLDEEKGSLSKYNDDNDCWEQMTESLEYLKGAERISAGRGKLCAVSGDGKKIVVVDLLARPLKVCILDSPQGMEVVAAHILPRMSVPEC